MPSTAGKISQTPAASAAVRGASLAAGLLLRRHEGLRKTFGGGLSVSALLALMS